MAYRGPLPSLPCRNISGCYKQYKGETAYSLVLGLGVYQLLAEGVPIAILRCLLDDNLSVIIGQLVDDELDLLVKLQLVEF